MRQMQTLISAAVVVFMLQSCTSLSTQSTLNNHETLNTGTKTMNNVDIVKSTYEGKTSEENGKNLKRYITSDTLWTEAAGFPYAGTYQGFDDIEKNVFARLGGEWINYKLVVEDYVAAGDKVFAYGTYSGTYKASGKFFTARVAHLWILKDGKVKSFEQFVDSKTVRDAM